MKFKDQLVQCGACGKQFVYTVREQRFRAEHGLPLDTPAFCAECRGADVRLAEAEATINAGATDASPSGNSGPVRPARSARRPSGPPRPPATAGGRRAPGANRPRSAGAAPGKGSRPSGAARRPAGGGDSRPPRPTARRAAARRQTELRVRFTGNVKWFDRERGYGFIAQEEGGDLFVHGSAILGGGPPVLEKGQPVEYEVERTERGLQAVDVVPLAW